jgi:5-methylcytosine-specific restriction endonuclease McrA
MANSTVQSTTDKDVNTHIDQKKVLVLNKGWKPVGIIGMQRAVSLLFSNYKGTNEPKARIIDPNDFQQYTWEDWSKLKPKEGEGTVLSSTATFRAPLVILLTKFDRLPMHKVSFSRKTMWRRDDFTCQYCGIKSPELTIDHIHPKSRGGKTTWDNCCLACVKCNMRKANRTPAEAKMNFFFPNYKPTKPKYNFFKNDIVKCKTWQQFLDAAYWSVELENDMK